MQSRLFLAILCLTTIFFTNGIFAQETGETPPETKKEETKEEQKADPTKEAEKKPETTEKKPETTEKKPETTEKKPETTEAAKNPPQMDPKEIQKRWMAHATTGKNHEYMMPLVGNWKTVSKYWMVPGQPPIVSEGSSHYEWAFGGRFLEQHFSGTIEGRPFQGRGIMSFDNFSKKYQSIWFDSMGTGFAISTGTADATGKVITYTGDMNDAGMGMTIKTKMVVTIKNYTEHTFAMYTIGPDGKEMQMMEILYTRK